MSAVRPPLPPGPYLVAGLGRAGQAAVAALLQLGAEVTAWDASHGTRVKDVRRALEPLGVRTFLGPVNAALDHAAPRTLVRSPGIPFDAPLLLAARTRGVEVVDELELGWRMSAVPLIGVTGTNGKSTVCGLTAALLAADGRDAVLAGNTTFGEPLSALRATPEWVVCEVSSFQLEACPALAPEVALFTNLSPDHLRRHGTLERYGACKRRLFVRGEEAVRRAVIDVGSAFGTRLAREVEVRGGTVARVGVERGADYRVLAARWDLRSAALRIGTPDGEVALATRLPGAHNARNVAAALALADTLGVGRGPALRALASHPGTPGRFEHVDAGQPFDVVVDIALTPAAVEHFLAAARAGMDPHGRLRVVLGAIGAPDPVHTAAMAHAARRLADDAALVPGNHRSGERREAIAAAFDAARPGDLVAIVGRGPVPETVREGETRRTVDDRIVARELLVARDAVVALTA